MIATRNLRSRNIKPTISGLLESDGQIQAQTQAQAMSVPTIPTILRRRKRCTEVGHYEVGSLDCTILQLYHSLISIALVELRELSLQAIVIVRSSVLLL